MIIMSSLRNIMSSVNNAVQELLIMSRIMSRGVGPCMCVRCLLVLTCLLLYMLFVIVCMLLFAFMCLLICFNMC